MSADERLALEFRDVTKIFTLQHDRPRSFKELFVRRLTSSDVEPDTLTALDNVSFRLEHGGTLGLVGPNGTGKSTVLKLAARILIPTSGTVRVRGRVAALLELGAGFHPDLTGRENVYLNGSLMGLDRKEMDSRLDAIIDFSELARFIDMPVKHYSSGMYMRLGFATAIHVDPEILLIDEVLAVGDQSFQNKCRDRITDLRRRGVTIVLVSHDIGAVRELCQRSLWLEDGEVRGHGPTDEVLDAYYRHVSAREEERLTTSDETQATAEEPANRWGTGDVEIVGVEVLGPDGQPHAVVKTGEPVAIRIRYTAAQPVEAPVFGIGIHRADGVHITGPNTRNAGHSIERVHGTGTVEFQIDELPLLEGTYEISASCYDNDQSTAYDYHHRRFLMRVRADHVANRLGAFHVPGQWRWSEGDGTGSGGAAETDAKETDGTETDAAEVAAGTGHSELAATERG